MKKSLALAIITIMLVAPLLVSAYDKEITFMGLRLGEATADDVIAAFVANGFEKDRIMVNDYETRFGVYLTHPSEKPTPRWFEAALGTSIEYYPQREERVFVAGHPVHHVRVYLTHGLVNGQIDTNSARLSVAQYAFDQVDEDAAFSDLFDKAQVVYGEYEFIADAYKFSKDHNISTAAVTWHGQEDSAVTLAWEWGAKDKETLRPLPGIPDSMVVMQYWRPGIVDDMEAMEAEYYRNRIAEEHKRIEDSKDDLTGL